MRLRLGRMVVAAGMTAATLGAFGCNRTAAPARNAIVLYRAGDYGAAANELKPTTTRRDENFVLDNCRYGSCALAAGQLANAETSFMAAYEVINGVNTNNGGRTMGAALVFEGIKVWKGEPFERAMAHYYLGVIFLIQHDYENARAAFQNSLFKLVDYASKDTTQNIQEHQSNFALGYFGLGFCYLRLGRQDLAQQNFEIAARLDPSLSTVISKAAQPTTNTLLFVDAGWGPQRAGKGWYNEESAFGPTPAEAGPVPPINVFTDGRLAVAGTSTPGPIMAPAPSPYPGMAGPPGSVPPGSVPPGNMRPGYTPASNNIVQYKMVDTLAMAQEQRWQDIDTIRKTKAVIGTGAMAAGAGVAAYGAEKHDEGTMWAGLGIAALGGALAASSQADLRYWEMLPRTVYVVPMSLPPGEHDIVVAAGPARSAPIHVSIPVPGATIPNNATPGAPGRPAPRDTVLYFRLR